MVLDLVSTTPPLGNCPLLQAPLAINNLYKQKKASLLVNLLIKCSMLQSPWIGLAPPLKFNDCPLVTRTTALDRLHVTNLFRTGPEGNNQRDIASVTSQKVSQRQLHITVVTQEDHLACRYHFRQCNHCGREEYYKNTSPVKRYRILRLF